MYVLHTHRLLKQTSDARAGMREFEILSRSSATLVALSGNDDSRLGFLGPRHVTEPWHYRNYYNLDWLQFVNSSHVKIFLGSRGVHAVARMGAPRLTMLARPQAFTTKLAHLWRASAQRRRAVTRRSTSCCSSSTAIDERSTTAWRVTGARRRRPSTCVTAACRTPAIE